MDVELKDDLLLGAKAIAEFLGCKDRQVYHMLAKRQLPGFKIGDVIEPENRPFSSILRNWNSNEHRAMFLSRKPLFVSYSPPFIPVQYVSLLRRDSVAIYAATIGNPREGKFLRL